MRKTILVATLSALFALLVGAGPAAADKPGESDESHHLVREAIALIVNTPGDMKGIEEKIVDALEAPKQQGVSLDLVQEAAALFPTEDMHQVRALLERSVGAQPHRGEGDPLPIGETRGMPGIAMATGAQTGTDVVIDPLAPDRELSGGDWLGLVGLVALAAVGGLLAAQLRPRLHHQEEARP